MDTLAETSAREMRSQEKNRPVYRHNWVPGPEDIVIDHAGGMCRAVRGRNAKDTEQFVRERF